MGYAYYRLPDGREAGYGVEAECDHDGCTERIDRGLGYLCGSDPDGYRDPGEPGCGRYYCPRHECDHDCPNPYGTCRGCDEPVTVEDMEDAVQDPRNRDRHMHLACARRTEGAATPGDDQSRT